MRKQCTPRLSLAARFWPKVDTTPGLFDCWPWLAGRYPRTNYGAFYLNGTNHHAHRIAYILTYGPIPEELIVRHLVCDNPPCCNPAHLAKGTHQDNVADRVRKGRSFKGPVQNRERWIRGDDHYSRSRPELLARGDKNGARVHIENMPRGEQHGMSKLTDSTVRGIIGALAAGQLGASIATRFGVSMSTVSAIKLGRAWRHVTGLSPTPKVPRARSQAGASAALQWRDQP